MNWKNFKIIVIVLLLILNIFIAFMLKDTYESTAFLSSDLILQSAANLETKGLYIEPSAIEKKIPEMYVYSYEQNIRYSNESYENYQKDYPFIQKLFSGIVQKNKKYEPNFFSIPSGISISVNEKNSDVPLGVISFTNDFDIEYINSEFSSENIDGYIAYDIFSAGNEDISKNDEKIVKKFFTSLYGKVGAGKYYKILGAENSPCGLVISCAMKIDGYEVCDKILNFCISDGKIMYIKGSWCFLPHEKSYDCDLIDGVNILYKTEKENITVLSEKMAYLSIKYENGKYFVIPTWILKYTYAGGDAINCLVDAVIGETHSEILAASE